ncbi:hypothetical protein K439DRAFT_1649592 [Ramaria rubella]|nr:hypothetical protein K439DRAFT_1649592 [Ramaria rubella]
MYHRQMSLCSVTLAMQLQVLLDRLVVHPNLLARASLTDVTTFMHNYWIVFAEVVWSDSTEPLAVTSQDRELFHWFGLLCGNFCSTNETLTLHQPSRYEVTLFMKAEGALPGFSHSVYCAKCHTQYHPNFRVNKEGSTCTYYEGVADIIQVSQWYYFETALLELQANQMCFVWVSSANCVRSYNQALQVPEAHKANNGSVFGNADEVPLLCAWQVSLSMSGATILDGFLLYSLLLDKAEHHEVLEHYAHACDLCCWIYENDKGIMGESLVKLQGAVSNGNTIRHPCCAIHDCKVPLENIASNLYCPVHLGYEAKCAVTVCQSLHEAGHLTCDNPNHRALDLGAKATSLDCDQKSPEGNQRLRAQFGRRQMHNEQLMIRPCGVIISQVTFFGSEAISVVCDFVLAAFPTPESTSEVFFYDTNCGLLKHCRNIGCHWLDQTAVVVDVFHFNCKHKQSDRFCQENCNPALFPELYVDGKWVFNLSIAEQTNVWFRGFLAIVREMAAVCFSFFLDEMIKQQNRYIVAELECKGHHP